MTYYATYKDRRDRDESAIAETQSVDEASDAIAQYFRQVPASLTHLEYWKITDETGREWATGTIVILD